VESGGSILLQAYSPSSRPNNTLRGFNLALRDSPHLRVLSPSPAKRGDSVLGWLAGARRIPGADRIGIGPDNCVAYTHRRRAVAGSAPIGRGVVSFDGQARAAASTCSPASQRSGAVRAEREGVDTIQVQYNGSLVGSMTVPVNGAASRYFPVAGRSFVGRPRGRTRMAR